MNLTTVPDRDTSPHDLICALWESFSQPVRRYIGQRVAEYQTAEDIAAQVWHKAVESCWGGNGPREHPRGWLYRIARNAVIDHYRARDYSPETSLEEWKSLPRPEQPDQAFERAYMQGKVRRAVSHLPDNQRIVTEYRMDGYELIEIANMIGKNHQATRAIQTRAYRNLRPVLDGVMPGIAEGRKKNPALGKLNPNYGKTHLVLADTLRERGALTLEQLSEASGISAHTVRSTLTRSHAHLFRRLHRHQHMSRDLWVVAPVQDD